MAPAKRNKATATNTRENIKVIIDCLKERRLSYSDLQIATGISPRTLSRMLDYLEYWRLAAKDQTRRWTWFEYTRTVDTRQDLDIAVKHSTELIKGLSALMVSLNSSRFSDSLRGLASKDERIFREAAEKHMRTGYEDIYDKIADYRVLMARREILALELGLFRERNPLELFNEIYTFRIMPSAVQKKEWRRLKRIIAKIPSDKLEEIDTVESKKNESYDSIADAVEIVITKIKNYEPLEGRCHLCPNVKIRSNRDGIKQE